jgi:hypothetical protein
MTSTANSSSSCPYSPWVFRIPIHSPEVLLFRNRSCCYVLLSGECGLVWFLRLAKNCERIFFPSLCASRNSLKSLAWPRSFVSYAQFCRSTHQNPCFAAKRLHMHLIGVLFWRTIRDGSYFSTSRVGWQLSSTARICVSVRPRA